MYLRIGTIGFLGLSLLACSGGDENGSSGDAAGTGGDGTFATGGATGVPTGGSAATGGFTATGGAAPVTGGSVATGGEVAGTGGAEATGGADATGGAEATGGADATGGSDATGGAAPVEKFVGNITTGNSIDTAGLTYSDYWDQITPENAGKWGSVQSSAGSNFNWSTLDMIYDYTQSHNILFKQHVFLWGAQQPGGTPTQDQVINWIKSFCERYPNTPLIDVVNEPPPHTTPNYVNNIGGGTNGDWAWITNAFKWAREYCPDSTLILNDFNNIEWPNDADHFISIVKTVLENGGPIDAIGAQAHDLDHEGVNVQTVTQLFNKLHDDTGLPIYITEMDLSYSDEAQQLAAYQQYFPMFWDADFVHGITIWGWIYGRTWSLSANSGLVTQDGKSRSAMTWLMGEIGRSAP